MIKQSGLARWPLSALAFSILASSASVSKSDEVAEQAGLTLPAFKAGYPGDVIRLQSAKAKPLALELLPIIADQTTSATISESVMLPGGTYAGLFIDFALEPRQDSRGICKQPHASVYYSYSGPNLLIGDVALAVRSGAIADHTFDVARWFGRYSRLPRISVAPERAIESCREAAMNTVSWKQAANIHEFVAEERRQAALVEAIRTLRPGQMTCVGVDGKACGYGREKLLSILRVSPPDHSQELFIPREGMLLLFSYAEKTSDVGTDYTVTMRRDLKDRPHSLQIRFERNFRPQI